MAALTITAVRPTADTVVTNQPVLYGATLAAGVPVYRNAADSEHLAADCDATEATRDVKGITLTPGVDGGYGYLAYRGSVILVGASMTEGAKYYLGPTAGEIVPFADLGSADYVVEIGTAISATELKLGIDDTGAQIA
jgi:hypothetical protein